MIIKSVLTLCDWHVPYEDPEAIEAAFGFAEQVQPSVIVLHELHDFYALSRFHRDPARRFKLQEELDQVNNYLDELHKRCPLSRFVLLESNHLDRLRRYLWSKAPELAGLRNLEVEVVLDLKRQNIAFMPTFEHRGFVWKHGRMVRKDSGLTARAELAKEWTSGCSGHTHRLGQIYQTKRDGEHTWIEAGCLCRLDPEYIEGTADWQHGMCLTLFDPELWYATTVPIIQGRVPFGALWKMAA